MLSSLKLRKNCESSDEFQELSYEDLYGSLESNKATSFTDLSNISSNLVIASNSPAQVPVENVTCSTPLRTGPIILNQFEELEDVASELSQEDESIDFDYEDAGVELFDGSKFSTSEFFSSFNEVARRNSFTGTARKDVLKLFSQFLPTSNNIDAPVQKDILPAMTSFNDGESVFIAISLLPQLKLILNWNSLLIKNSWLSDCSWSFGKTEIKINEVLLNVNIDGAALFKSSSFSVWPVWFQIFNLPEKLGGKFSNHALLGLWHGKSKPNWEFFLKKISIEIECFLEYKTFIDGLGFCLFTLLFLICDMPAMAPLCCHVQFNGYYGCPYCYTKGVYFAKRMTYPVMEPVCRRENCDYEKNAEFQRFGVKGKSPLHQFFPIPWFVPIDPMHQVFLGCEKILTKALVSKLKSSKIDVSSDLCNCMVPYESLHKANSLHEIKLWKAADFKLFFFHFGPLLIRKLKFFQPLAESFCRLSLAIRLLSEKEINEAKISYAELQIKKFFDSFLFLFGNESQSFNFHSLRHLVYQVRRFGPLWLYSAFSFESANHLLLRSVAGSIKTPDKIVEKFLLALFSGSRDAEIHEINTKLYTKLNSECRKFGSENNLRCFESRFVKNTSIFTSSAFSYNKSNFSNSFSQLSTKDFVKIEFYAKTIDSENVFAVVRFLKAKPVKLFFEDMEDSFVLLYRLSQPGGLNLVRADLLKYKCVLLKLGSETFLASVMREGFEHN